ncbi:MAG: ATPase [Capsulimonas sp.]|nr:ATPase [Capsulimonas sp.]
MLAFTTLVKLTPFVIDSLTIQGFKSFDMDAPAMRLGALNFIVGANGSGKSNLLAALRFLRIALLEDLDAATAAFGGVEEVRNFRLRQASKPKPVIFELSLRDPAAAVMHVQGTVTSDVRHIRYRLVLDLRGNDHRAVVQEEELVATIDQPGAPTVQFRAARSLDSLHIKNPVGAGGPADLTQPVTELNRSKLIGAAGFLGEPMAILRAYVQSWNTYSVDPSAARRPAEATFGESIASNGERLGAIIHEIADERTGSPEVMNAIRSAVQGFVPGFQDIQAVPLPYGRTKWGFRVKEAGLSRMLNPDLVSDGTVRLVTLIVLAEWCARRSALTMIEEPENGLHPHLTESMVGLFRSAAQHGQLLITTHHAGFLDYLEPEELLLCAREDDGNTRICRAAEREEREHFKKGFTLGEMWTMGLFQ